MSRKYGLIFDVDGVIADTEAVNARASIKVFADLFGLSQVTRADFEAGLGRGAEEYVKAAAAVHGLQLSSEQVAAATKMRQEYFLQMLSQQPLPPFPGVLELINEALRRDDFGVAIATSSTRSKSEAVLQSAKIPYEKMVYITGSDVTHKKPHPQLFLLAVERLAVPAENCVVIEDAPDGIEAAHTAGCKCIAVTNSAPAKKLAQAELVVDTLTGLDPATIIELLESVASLQSIWVPARGPL